MDENRQKKPLRKENPVREWISDNLRYILLILGIAVIIVLIVLAVRFLSARENGGASADLPVMTESDSSAPEEEKTTGTPTPSAEATATPTPEKTDTDAALTDADAEINDLMNRYYQALSDKDTETLRELTDAFTEEDAAAVSGNQETQNYTCTKISVCPGIEENSYVVFVQYGYQYVGFTETVPALTQFYVYQNADGQYVLASEITDSDLQTHMDSLLEQEDVKALISEVQENYDAVMSGNAELKAHAES